MPAASDSVVLRKLCRAAAVRSNTVAAACTVPSAMLLRCCCFARRMAIAFGAAARAPPPPERVRAVLRCKGEGREHCAAVARDCHDGGTNRGVAVREQQWRVRGLHVTHLRVTWPLPCSNNNHQPDHIHESKPRK